SFSLSWCRSSQKCWSAWPWLSAMSKGLPRPTTPIYGHSWSCIYLQLFSKSSFWAKPEERNLGPIPECITGHPLGRSCFRLGYLVQPDVYLMASVLGWVFLFNRASARSVAIKSGYFFN